jgi:arylsulfatase A-like enzyme
VRLTRRGLIGSAASGGLLASMTLPARAVAQEREASALLVVLPLVRADYVKAFENGSGTDTPNLNDLTGDSLRFDRAIPECMPALPVRRTLLTGMRSYPFRDWKRTNGLPAVPGYSPIWDWQPVVTETMRAAGAPRT